MAETRYQLVFAGRLAPKRPREQVEQALQRRFRLSDAQVARLFVQQPVIVKRDVDARTAERYRQAFASAGAVVELRPLAPPTATDDAAAPPTQPITKPTTGIDAGGELQVLPPGAAVAEETPAATGPPPDVSHLSLAPGEDMSLADCAPQQPPPPNLDPDRYSLEPLADDDSSQRGDRPQVGSGGADHG